MRIWILKSRDAVQYVTMDGYFSTGFPNNPTKKPTPEFYSHFKVLKIKEYNDIAAL